PDHRSVHENGAAFRRILPRLLVGIALSGMWLTAGCGDRRDEVTARGQHLSATTRPTAQAAAADLAQSNRPPLKPVLRVAADPNNLPFSNDKGEGFAHKIAELVAR